MRRLRFVLGILAMIGVAAASASIVPGRASGALMHQSGCHRWHSCPSDHATYRWRGLRCVKPSADERNSTFRIRVRYGGLTYYCKR
jgi:hypothetical protein